MVGMGESYFAAFVLALGHGEVLSGLVSTVPLLLGGALQLVTPAGVRHLGSRKRWAVTCATVQCLSFVPLIIGALAGDLSTWALFASASVYWGAGMAAGPAWNAWVEWLVPAAMRTRFFARRSSFVQLGVLTALVGGGLILQQTEQGARPLLGFAVLFTAALLARAGSGALLAAQSEPPLPTAVDSSLPAMPFLRRWPTGPAARLVLYLLLLTTAVQIASPFFSAYMLVSLDCDYWQYMTLVGTAMLAKVLVLPLLAGVAQRLGLVFLLRLAWVGIAAVPVLWLVSSAYPYLLLLQVTAGSFWAMHEYATFLLLFQTIHIGRRVGILTAYNLGNAVATVVGSLLGGKLFRVFGDDGFMTLFVVSSVARAACVGLLARVRDARVPTQPVLFRPIAARPGIGVVLRPILSTIRRRSPEDAVEGAAEGGGVMDNGPPPETGRHAPPC